MNNNNNNKNATTTYELLKLHLTSIYIEKFYFWECIIMLKRLFIVIALTLLRMYTDIQLLLILLITFLYLSFVLYARPYINPSHNYMSFISNMTQFMVAFAGLVFYLSKKARTNYCVGLENNNNNEKLEMGGEIFMLYFIYLYFILLLIFILYQMKDTISYLCSMRWLNLFKSFEKIDDDDEEEEEEEEDKDMNINNIEMTMEGISNNDGDDTIRV